MGGWEEVVRPYSRIISRRNCKCGKGEVITQMIVEEESDYPPLFRGPEEVYSTCPDKCEG